MVLGKNPDFQTRISSILPTSKEGDSAVGVHESITTECLTATLPARKWFVAVVKNNTELKMHQFFEARDIESFVAVQLDATNGKNGKKKPRQHVIIPARLMLHVTEAERKELVRLPGILRFLTDMAQHPDRFGHHPLAVIPDTQMNQLRLILAHASSEIEVELNPPSVGDRVRVISGPLEGVEGMIVKDTGNSKMYVSLGTLGCIKTTIDNSILEKV